MKILADTIIGCTVVFSLARVAYVEYQHRFKKPSTEFLPDNRVKHLLPTYIDMYKLN